MTPDANTADASPSAVPVFDARADAIQRNMQRRLATNAGSGANEAVSNGASSHTVTFKRREPDANYAVHVMTSWATTVHIPSSDKTQSGFTVHFATAAGAAATIDYLVYRAG